MPRLLQLISCIVGGSLLASFPARAQDGAVPIGILLAAGDIAKCNPSRADDEATASVLDAAVSEANALGIPVRVLALGDLAYDDGTSEEFQCFNASWGAFKSVMLPAPGNHEYENPPDKDAKPYFEYFSELPAIDSRPLVGSNGSMAGYYAFNFPDLEEGPWRLLALNAYTKAAGGKAAQLEWLNNDLTQNRAPCVLAFWHPYVLSSGHHGHADGDSEVPRIGRTMVAAFDVLLKHGASVLLTAHDHDFEQFAAHDAEGKKDEAGVRSFVIGTGGGRLYKSAMTSRWQSSEVFQDESHGVLRLELYSDHYTWDFLPIEGDSDIELPVASQPCAERKDPQ